jgi:hypothetical protein
MANGLLLAAAFQPTNPHTSAALGRAVESLSPGVFPAAAAALGDQLIQVMPLTKDTHVLAAQVRAVAALANRSDRELKAKVDAGVAGRLLDAMTRTSDPFLLANLGQAVTALSTSRLGAVPDERVFATALLKYPTCIGAGRRTLLRELGRRLGPHPAPETASAVTIAILQPCPLASAAAATDIASIYPGGHIPFVNLWDAMEFLGVHHPELDLSGPMLPLER